MVSNVLVVLVVCYFYIFANFINLHIYNSPFCLATAQSQCLLVIRRDGGFQSEDGVVWLWHVLVKLHIYIYIYIYAYIYWAKNDRGNVMTSMLLWLVSTTAFFRNHFFILQTYVLLTVLYLTSNKLSITHPRDKVW